MNIYEYIHICILVILVYILTQFNFKLNISSVSIAKIDMIKSCYKCFLYIFSIFDYNSNQTDMTQIKYSSKYEWVNFHDCDFPNAPNAIFI